MYLSIASADRLWFVIHGRQGEMLRKDREGVDEKFEERIAIPVVDYSPHLLLRTIILAEETRALSYRCLVHLCTCGYDS